MNRTKNINKYFGLVGPWGPRSGMYVYVMCMLYIYAYIIHIYVYTIHIYLYVIHIYAYNIMYVYSKHFYVYVIHMYVYNIHKYVYVMLRRFAQWLPEAKFRKNFRAAAP